MENPNLTYSIYNGQYQRIDNIYPIHSLIANQHNNTECLQIGSVAYFALLTETFQYPLYVDKIQKIFSCSINSIRSYLSGFHSPNYIPHDVPLDQICISNLIRAKHPSDVWNQFERSLPLLTDLEVINCFNAAKEIQNGGVHCFSLTQFMCVYQFFPPIKGSARDNRQWQLVGGKKMGIVHFAGCVWKREFLCKFHFGKHSQHSKSGGECPVRFQFVMDLKHQIVFVQCFKEPDIISDNSNSTNPLINPTHIAPAFKSDGSPLHGFTCQLQSMKEPNRFIRKALINKGEDANIIKASLKFDYPMSWTVWQSLGVDLVDDGVIKQWSNS